MCVHLAQIVEAFCQGKPAVHNQCCSKNTYASLDSVYSSFCAVCCGCRDPSRGITVELWHLIGEIISATTGAYEQAHTRVACFGTHW
jgi:hypothetical protein